MQKNYRPQIRVSINDYNKFVDICNTLGLRYAGVFELWAQSIDVAFPRPEFKEYRKSTKTRVIGFRADNMTTDSFSILQFLASEWNVTLIDVLTALVRSAIGENELGLPLNKESAALVSTMDGPKAEHWRNPSSYSYHVTRTRSGKKRIMEKGKDGELKAFATDNVEEYYQKRAAAEAKAIVHQPPGTKQTLEELITWLESIRDLCPSTARVVLDSASVAFRYESRT